MALAALEVVGILFNGIAAIPTLVSIFGPDTKDATNVRVLLGASTDEADSLGGNTPGVSLWDFNGHAIGFTDGKSTVIGQADFVDITVFPRTQGNNVPANYVSITNGGDDGICIAGISLTFPDSSQAGFDANVAATCGAFWANSNTQILGQPPGPRLEPAKCIWLDRDGSFGHIHQGMGLHIPSFSAIDNNLATSYHDNNDLMCKSGPRFRMYEKLVTEDPILVFPHPPEFVQSLDNPNLTGTDLDPSFIINNPGIPAANLYTDAGGPVSPNQRRNIHRRNQRINLARSNSTVGLKNSNSTQRAPQRPLAERLIISPHSFNSARELCESQTSYGHSFVSLQESLFCDMTTKILYYTCSDKISSCCLDVDEASFRACEEGSSLPTNNKINGTLVQAPTVRSRSAIYGLAEAMIKDRKIYDSVQRWG